MLDLQANREILAATARLNHPRPTEVIQEADLDMWRRSVHRKIRKLIDGGYLEQCCEGDAENTYHISITEKGQKEIDEIAKRYALSTDTVEIVDGERIPSEP